MIRKRICLILAGIVLLFSTVFPSVADEPVESTLPDHYLSACPEQGTVTSHRYKGKEEINVWTPYGYSEHRLYEIVLLMHGDGGTLRMGGQCTITATAGAKSKRDTNGIQAIGRGELATNEER